MRVVLSIWMAALSICALAEKLPVTAYTAADGLAHNSINRIVHDRYGYLWVCTGEGVSRFDGYEFRTYRRSDGLPHRDVHDLLETRAGEYWLATASGLCRYRADTSALHRFETFRVDGNDHASYINVLAEDRDGTVWCGSDGGLLRVERESNTSRVRLSPVELGFPNERPSDRVVSALLEDRRGTLWIGAGGGLIARRSERNAVRYTIHDGLPDNYVTALLEDRRGRLWVGTSSGLCRLIWNEASGRARVERFFRKEDGLAANAVEALHQGSDGQIWVGTRGGLSVFREAKQCFKNYGRLPGLNESAVTALGSDAAGNLWVGTDGGGAGKLPPSRFVTYEKNDGLSGERIDSIFESEDSLYALSRQGTSAFFLNEFDGRRFHAYRVNLPRGVELLDWGARGESVARDGEKNWWFATRKGLYRFRGTATAADLSRRTPDAVYTERELSSNVVTSVFADRRGEVWVSVTGVRNAVLRWDRKRRLFEAEGLQTNGFGGVSLFADGLDDTVWMGLLRFGPGQFQLGRWRGGQFEYTGEKAEALGGVRALYLDRVSRLWVGTNQNGLTQIETSNKVEPQVTNLTTRDGLSSDVILSLTGDQAGDIYVGTAGGVDRVNPATRRIEHYSAADGLAAGEVHAAYCDHTGTVWFGTARGISRWTPILEPVLPPPPVRILALVAGGARQAISETGVSRSGGFSFSPSHNNVQVDFGGLDFEAGAQLRYQYMLDGAAGGWSAPVRQRSVMFANLSPGSYEFRVRAIDSQGVPSAQPAAIGFTILPPFWLRWWFELAAAGLAALIIYQAHRYRAGRLLELERIRTRIATDLHDDIGSSLSQIAILSEVAHRQLDATQTKAIEPLADIGGISRELIDSMADIVWAVDPKQDRLSHLTQRMRRFSSDLLSQRDIDVKFRSSEDDGSIELGADLRRQIFLIFKEAIRNIERHARATAVDIEFEAVGGWMQLSIQDNGGGFNVAEAKMGHGLDNIRERARQIGGHCTIVSEPGAGCRIELRVKLRPSIRNLHKQTGTPRREPT